MVRANSAGSKSRRAVAMTRRPSPDGENAYESGMIKPADFAKLREAGVEV